MCGEPFAAATTPHRSRVWWVALAAAVLLAAGVGAVLALLATDGDDETSGDDESTATVIRLQGADDDGHLPFTPSITAVGPDDVRDLVTLTTVLPDTTTAQLAVVDLAGDTPSLYGGSTDPDTVCDIDALAAHLDGDPDTAAAWASIIGIDPTRTTAALHELTPAVLPTDTLVVNHGYRDGEPVPFDAVLEAGTAVLVDDHGLPTVRCACGNPLLPIDTVDDELTFDGDHWDDAGRRPIARITPSPDTLTQLQLVDITDGRTIQLAVGPTTTTSSTTSSTTTTSTTEPPTTEPPVPSIRSVDLLNALLPANSCVHGTVGWPSGPIQLSGGDGQNFPAGETSGGASVADAAVLGHADLDGDGDEDVLLSVDCFGSPPELCCAGRSSRATVLVPLSLQPDGSLALVGHPILGLSSPTDMSIGSATMDGPRLVTSEYVVYPESESEAELGFDPYSRLTVVYTFDGSTWQPQR